MDNTDAGKLLYAYMKLCTRAYNYIQRNYTLDMDGELSDLVIAIDELEREMELFGDMK